MKIVLSVLLFSVVALPVQAQIYKSVDPGGRTVYSDAPPPPDNSSVSIVTTTVSPAAPQQNTRWEGKDQAFRQRIMAKENEQAKEDFATAAAAKACDSARASMNELEKIYGRHAFRRDDNGERAYITDEERITIEKNAQESIAKNCK